MTRIRCSLVLIAIALATTALAGEIVLPGFAWQLPGKGLNRWTSEVYATNPGTAPVSFRYERAAIGRVKTGGSCLPYIRWYEVAPQSTLVVSAEHLATDIGCVQEFVGGLVMTTNGELAMSSRMTNVFQPVNPPPSSGLLSGFGQEIPGIRIENLPGSGVSWIMPGLITHPNACGAVKFQSYVHFSTPTDVKVTVTLTAGRPGQAGRLVVDGREVVTPHALTVEGLQWRQLLIALPDSAITVCGEPVVFDLIFETTGPVAVYGSVVDRTTQDPRTVMPLSLTP